MWLNENAIEAFADELKKIAYGELGHSLLAERTLSTMGAPAKAPGTMGQLVTKGSLATDVGIRHPLALVNPDIHAMPGRPKMRILREAVKTRRGAVKDIASAAARSQGVLQQAQATKGLMNLGQAHHTYVGDLAAHYEKPVESGLVGRNAPTIKGRALGVARRVVPRIPASAPLATLLSGAEHSLNTNPVVSLLNDLRGKPNPIDVLGTAPSDTRAARRAHTFGVSSKRRILQQIQKQHGMSAAEAEAAFSRLMASPAPGRISQAVGSFARNVGYLRGRLSQFGRYLR